MWLVDRACPNLIMLQIELIRIVIFNDQNIRLRVTIAQYGCFLFPVATNLECNTLLSHNVRCQCELLSYCVFVLWLYRVPCVIWHTEHQWNEFIQRNFDRLAVVQVNVLQLLTVSSPL